MNFFEALPTFNDQDTATLPSLTLAFVGDAVYELYVRTVLLEKSRVAKMLSKATVARVNHGLQSKVVAAIEAELTDKEEAVLHRGRNAHGSVPKNGSLVDYRRATGLEALVGYLYLSGQHDRLIWVLEHIEPVFEEAL